jgi:hypothetical protein
MRVDLAIGAGPQDMKLQTNGARRLLNACLRHQLTQRPSRLDSKMAANGLCAT